MWKIKSPFVYLKNNWAVLVKKLITFFVIPIGIYLVALFSPEGTLSYRLLSEPSGNLLAELYGGYFFLYIALMIQRSTDKKIDELHEELEIIKYNRKYQRMIDFLKTGTHYDISLEEYNDDEDNPLTYNISPARDAEGNPAYDDDGLSKRYILKVNSISYRSVLSDEQMSGYLKSPISPGENYFISFRDGKWGFYDVHDRRGHIPFYWTGKNGNCRIVPCANEIMKVKEGFTELAQFVYSKSTGTLSRSGAAGYIFKDDNNRIYVSPRMTSSPKRVFITYPENDYQKSNPYMKIENIFGHFDSVESLNNFKGLLKNKFEELEITLDDIDWWDGKEIPGM